MACRRHSFLWSKAAIVALLFVGAFASGCSTMENGRRWGEDATLRPGLKKVGRSALDALTSPMFYVPAAAALLLQIDQADRRISDWAMEHTPVFGSMRGAEQRSEDIRSASSYLFYLSVLATPGGNEPVPWAVSKAKGALVQQSAVSVNHFLVNTVKDATNHKRPDRVDDRSFPSSRTANVTAFTSLASRNVSVMNLPGQVKTAFKAVLYTAPFVTAWARVEAGAHYPADALAGISQGYFVTTLINDSLMGLDRRPAGAPTAWFGPNGVYLGYCLRF